MKPRHFPLRVRLQMVVAEGDAAETGIRYGRTNAAVYGILASRIGVDERPQVLHRAVEQAVDWMFIVHGNSSVNDLYTGIKRYFDDKVQVMEMLKKSIVLLVAFLLLLAGVRVTDAHAQTPDGFGKPAAVQAVADTPAARAFIRSTNAGIDPEMRTAAALAPSLPEASSIP